MKTLLLSIAALFTVCVLQAAPVYIPTSNGTGTNLLIYGGFRLGSGTMIGNGAGLTNLGANQPIIINTNVTINNTLVVSGKATFTSNVVFRVIDFYTNSHPSSGNISLTNSWGAFATNNNTTFDNLAGIDSAATNVQSVMVNITNSSAGAKTIVMNARFQNLKPEQSNTLFVTNFAQLLVFLYPGMGTNYYFQSR